MVCNTPVILTSVIDLKEAPWEEGHLLLELRNLSTTEGRLAGLSSSINSPLDHSQHTQNIEHHLVVTSIREPLPVLTLEKPGNDLSSSQGHG
jgi:hypothetical protein